MRTIVTGVAALALLGGCQSMRDITECEAEANQFRTRAVVTDQVCTTGRGVFGGIVTTCQAVPREAYVDTHTARVYVEACLGARRAERNHRP